MQHLSHDFIKMKHRKSMKHKLAEISYNKPKLKKKLDILEKSMKEVNKILNDMKQ